jgi:hypothetical protein
LVSGFHLKIVSPHRRTNLPDAVVEHWFVIFSAWRVAETGELADEELYPSDAQWSGIYDRMHTHEPDEMERRLALAADYGDGFAE